MKVGDIIKVSAGDRVVELERQGERAWYLGVEDAEGEVMLAASIHDMGEFEMGREFERTVQRHEAMRRFR